MIDRQVLSEKWIKASIIGTIWAASEIVLGSFFHNLRIPFSSNILTAIGILIMVSSGYIWNEKGIFWRAGLVCALMKSMSPSAIIFGPMIAIFSQSVFLELLTRIFGKTPVGYISGAMLAMSWNLIHKIGNYVILYGFNLVNLYTDLLKYAQKQLHISVDLVWSPILILIILYASFGAVAAIIGMRVGRKVISQPSENQLANKAYTGIEINKPRKTSDYSIPWLFANLACMITSFILFAFTPWFIWIPVAMIISFIWIIHYRTAMRKLLKPRFWILFVVITMATTWLYSRIISLDVINGLMLGIQMNLRAAIVILGFSVIGTELYNPKIRDFFLRTPLKQLPLALELSFQSLPFMIAHMPDVKTIIKNPVSVIYRLISQINYRLDEVKRILKKKIFIISGALDQGKTTQIIKILDTLKAKNISAGGIFSPKIIENNAVIGYDVVDITTGEQTRFLRKEN
ncbi:MAG: nucleoside-triphosphatase, partial [Bacteroidales bacterium]|nr:nucleoside-triphosphatase [Bacteroidales bacterium]